jgi:hypothetical protein
MWIQNTDFCRNVAREIENTKRFILHTTENKESGQANFFKLRCYDVRGM